MDKFAVRMRSLELRTEQIERILSSKKTTTAPNSEQFIGARTTGASAIEKATEHLKREGINPELVRLPPSIHRLREKDTEAALWFGGVGALLPSVGFGNGFVVEALQAVQRAADGGKLPSVFQAVFGNKAAPQLDSSKGRLHRFDGSHDLFRALPSGIRSLGLVRGSIEVSQHLLTDSFGVTGIPIPGSHSFANHLNASELSRYTAFRMSDVAASGTTALLLWTYFEKEQIPENSMRRPQMALLAHGACLGSTALATALLGVGATVRSGLNFVSIGSMIRSYLQVREMTNRLMESNDKRLRALLSKIKTSQARRELPIDDFQIETETHKAVLYLAQ